jgi:hypothetical protein
LVVQKKDVLDLVWKKVSAEHKDASSWFVLIQNEKKRIFDGLGTIFMTLPKKIDKVKISAYN